MSREKNPNTTLVEKSAAELMHRRPANLYDPDEDLRCQETQIWGKEEEIMNYLSTHVLLSEKQKE